MNDKPLTPPSKIDELEALLNEPASPGPMDQSVSSLEARLEDVANRRLEERFLWGLLCMVLADAYIFTQMASQARRSTNELHPV